MQVSHLHVASTKQLTGKGLWFLLCELLLRVGASVVRAAEDRKNRRVKARREASLWARFWATTVVCTETSRMLHNHSMVQKLKKSLAISEQYAWRR